MKFPNCILAALLSLGIATQAKAQQSLTTYIYSDNEKAEIEALANKYGMSLLFYEKGYGSKPSIVEIEERIKIYKPTFNIPSNDSTYRKQVEEKNRQIRQDSMICYSAQELYQMDSISLAYGFNTKTKPTVPSKMKITVARFDTITQRAAALREIYNFGKLLEVPETNLGEENNAQIKFIELCVNHTQISEDTLKLLFTKSDFLNHQIPLKKYQDVVAQIERMNKVISGCPKSKDVLLRGLNETLDSGKFFLWGFQRISK